MGTRSLSSRQSKNPGVGGVWGGHGERLSVGLKEVLASCSATQEGKAGSGCFPFAQAMLSRGGELLTQTEDIAGRWKEHFEELLNPANTSSGEEAEYEASREAPPISLAEVAEVVKQLFSGKAPGVDEIRPEMLKALDIVGLSWLTRLFNVAWGSGTVPVVVTFFKKGDRRVCSNYWGITLLSLPGFIPGCLKGGSGRLSNLNFRRSNMDSVLAVEQWTSSLPLLGCWGVAWEFAHPVYMCFVDLEKA